MPHAATSEARNPIEVNPVDRPAVPGAEVEEEGMGLEVAAFEEVAQEDSDDEGPLNDESSTEEDDGEAADSVPRPADSARSRSRVDPEEWRSGPSLPAGWTYREQLRPD